MIDMRCNVTSTGVIDNMLNVIFLTLRAGAFAERNIDLPFELLSLWELHYPMQLIFTWNTVSRSFKVRQGVMVLPQLERGLLQNLTQLKWHLQVMEVEIVNGNGHALI